MKTVLWLCISISLFSFLAVAHADDKSDLWGSARKVFERSCLPCHGAGPRAARDFFVLKPEDLSQRLDAIKDRVLEPSGRDRMPPSSFTKSFERYGVSKESFDRLGLQAGDTDVIKKWLDQGAPIVEADDRKKEFIRDKELIAAIHDDAQGLPETDRKFARYLSLANLLRAGDSPGELAVDRNAVRKLLASLTWRTQAPGVKVVEKSKGTALRFDIRQLEYPGTSVDLYRPWDSSLWEELARANPYGLGFSGAQALEVEQWLGTKNIFLRADFFAFHTTQPAVYARILGLPSPEEEDGIFHLEADILGVEVARDLREGKAQRAGTTRSGVSVNYRMIERRVLPDGRYYWTSYDFRSTEGRGNILEFPLGPGNGPRDFQHAGGEFIFSLPDGLQGYLLTNAAGKVLANAPTEIVQNPTRRDAVVQNGISCMECHAQGMRPNRADMSGFRDEVRAFLEATEENAEVLAAVKRLHPGTEAIRAAIEGDRGRFEAALEHLGLEKAVDSQGKLIDAEPISHLVQRFQGTVELKDAAAELDMSADELKALFNLPFLSENKTIQRLAARLDITSVSRDEFIVEFEKLRAVKRGEAPGRSFTPSAQAPQEGKGFTIPLDTSGGKLEMIWIAPGTFNIGSPPEEQGRHPDSELLHRVRLTTGFWMGKTEVTQEQYLAIARDNPIHFKDPDPKFPVENATFEQAVTYCEKLNEHEGAAGRVPRGFKYRIPTEAEWEFACRAGTSGPFYEASLDEIAWYESNSGNKPHPVGEKKPNSWGLHDMLGNATEWTQWLGDYPKGEVTDPPVKSRGAFQMIRGGSWGSKADACRSAVRFISLESGFRIVLGVPVE